MDIIGLLFKSKIRQKILTRFFADESRKFYINEMARLVDTSQGTCRRELNRLADAGFLRASRIGNLLYYEINNNSLFYKEFRAIVQKTIGIEGMIRSGLQGLKGISFAFIFGSYVKDEFRPDSDIDIVIIGPVSEDRIINTFRKIERSTSREINYHMYSLREFKNKIKTDSFMKNIVKKYIIVAGDNGDFRKLLKEN